MNATRRSAAGQMLLVAVLFYLAEANVVHLGRGHTERLLHPAFDQERGAVHGWTLLKDAR